MNDSQPLWKVADNLLEEYKFSEAITLFRQSAIGECPSQFVLTNLGVAENEDQLQFRRQLAQLYPDDLECRLSEILLYNKFSKWLAALQLATKLLEERKGDGQAEISIRLARLRAALGCGDSTVTVEDVVGLWNLLDQLQISRDKLFSNVLKRLAAADRPQLATAMSELAKSGLFPDSISRFLLAKSTELRLLKETKTALRDVLNSPGSKGVNSRE